MAVILFPSYLKAFIFNFGIFLLAHMYSILLAAKFRNYV